MIRELLEPLFVNDRRLIDIIKRLYALFVNIVGVYFWFALIANFFKFFIFY